MVCYINLAEVHKNGIKKDCFSYLHYDFCLAKALQGSLFKTNQLAYSSPITSYHALRSNDIGKLSLIINHSKHNKFLRRRSFLCENI